MTFLVRKAGEYTPHPEGSLEIIPKTMDEAFQLGQVFEELQQNNAEVRLGSRDMIRVLIPLNSRQSMVKSATE